MARKKKIQIEKHPGIPRGAEHLEQLNPALPGARLDQSGREIPSNEPIVLHLKRRTVTDLETLRLQIQAIRATDGPVEFETFAEADDFDIEDSFGDFTSRWEVPADQDPVVTVEQYAHFMRTGEIPAHVFPQDPPSPPGAPPAAVPAPPVQGGDTPPPPAGKP